MGHRYNVHNMLLGTHGGRGLSVARTIKTNNKKKELNIFSIKLVSFETNNHGV